MLQTKRGDVAARLLQEAVLYQEGINGLVKLAEENCFPGNLEMKFQQ